MNDSVKTYTLLGVDGKPYQSSTPGLLGGHKKLKIYGRLDCPSALRYIAKGQYVKNRVFFKDEETAIAAGFRPCAKCMPKEYKLWKEKQGK
jgi:methylphosphotriester-DNA--protein-cysteine methyltransferase